MAGEVLDWIRDHIWVPIVGSLVLIIVIALLIWLVFRLCRNYRRYDYTALEQDMAFPEKMRVEQKLQRDSSRDAALMNCGFYLRAKRSFTLIEHLNEIGNRVDSHWFMVSDVRRQTLILTMFPCPSQLLPSFTVATKNTLAELFILLQHPYLYPLCEMDFILEQGLIAILYPYNQAGSLKDLIYKSKPLNTWSSKYTYRGQGFPVKKVQVFGKQILQAMLFLEEKGLPPHYHVHSGNVMVTNGVCRVAAYENNILGLAPGLQSTVRKKLREGKKEGMQSLSFGHLLYEMSAGCILDTPSPEPRHLVLCPHDIIQVLNFIFPPEGGQIPSISENLAQVVGQKLPDALVIYELRGIRKEHFLTGIISHSFFQFVRLKEAEMFNIAPIHFSPNIKSLLKAVRRGKFYKSKSRKRSSIASESDSYRRSTSRQSSVMVEEETVFGSPLPSPAPPPPPPPPPPAIPPPPAPGGPPSYSAATSDRGALLSGIRGGANLKKTKTNDRSDPKV